MNRLRIVCAAAFVAAFALLATADAQQCGSVRVIHRAPVYHAPAYVAPVHHAVHHAVQEVVVTQFVPVYVPAYSIGYTPAVPGQDSLQLQLDLARLQLEVEKLKRLPLSSQGSAPDRQPQALPQKAPAGLLGQRCGACHDAASAKAKGGGVVLVADGRLRGNLTGEELGSVVDAIQSGRMPRGSKLSDREKLDLVVEAVTK